jgi:Zn-dependent peptidase ImmA (M78 family)
VDRRGRESFERIHHAPTTSPVHRQQFLNHEFGHMILNQELELLSVERVALLAPLTPMDAIAFALSRSQFTDEQEALAEAIADRLAPVVGTPR